MTTETSQTLDRGLRVLRFLADTPHGLTVSELASRIGVNRTIVYRLLATLEQHSLVRRDFGGRARVGLGVLSLAHQVHPLLREAALPALRSLAEEVGATAHLTLVDGTEALTVAVVEPTWTEYHVVYRTGLRHPLDRGAAGLAILQSRARAGRSVGVRALAIPAQRAASELGETAELPQPHRHHEHPQDLNDPQHDWPGYVLTHGEPQPGASGAAAPLNGVTGIEGSVGVVMLAESVPEEVGPRVVRAAREVSEALR